MNADLLQTWFGLLSRLFGLFFLVPVMAIQFKETKIRDNIVFIRWGIFIGTLLYTVLSCAFLTVNIGRLMGLIGNNVINILSLSAGIANLIISAILYAIYHKDYEGGDTNAK